MELKLSELKCQRCGGELKAGENGIFTCKNCGKNWQSNVLNEYDTVLRSAEDALNNKIIELVANQRRLLWKEVNKLNVSNARVEECCKEILKYLPEDFYANFYLATCSKHDGALAEFFRPTDLRTISQDDIILMAEYLTRRVKEEWILIADNLISVIKDEKIYSGIRADFNRKKQDFDDCVFNPDYHRNVFVCYASEDMAIVTEVVSALECEGIKCFVAARNLQHGSGAVEEYNEDIHRAIKNCDMILFFSSSHSRSLYRDPYTKEIKYIKENIDGLRSDYRMPRLEYIITRYQDTERASDDVFKEFFDGKERCETNDVKEVVRRVHKILGGKKTEPAPEEKSKVVPVSQSQPEQKPVVPQNPIFTPERFESGKKLCRKCGTAVNSDVKCCVNCGNKGFYENFEEYRITTLKYCANCGRANEEDYNCCPECGSSDFVGYEKHLKLEIARAKGPLAKRILFPIGRFFKTIGMGIGWLFGELFELIGDAIDDAPAVVWAIIWGIVSIAGLVVSIIFYGNTGNVYALGGIIGSGVSIGYTIYGVIAYYLVDDCEEEIVIGIDLAIALAALIAFIVLMFISQQTVICGMFIAAGLVVPALAEFISTFDDELVESIVTAIGGVVCVGIALILLWLVYGF